MRERCRTAEGVAGTEVVLGVFRANGAFLAAGNRLAEADGLTSARWQVLGAVVLAGRPVTVPQVARRMGLTRQSVQASVNALLAGGLLAPEPNPDHRRSPLMRATERGHAVYQRLDRRQTEWINEIVTGFTEAELTTTVRVLSLLTERLDSATTSEDG